MPAAEEAAEAEAPAADAQALELAARHLAARGEQVRVAPVALGPEVREPEVREPEEAGLALELAEPVPPVHLRRVLPATEVREQELLEHLLPEHPATAERGSELPEPPPPVLLDTVPPVSASALRVMVRCPRATMPPFPRVTRRSPIGATPVATLPASTIGPSCIRARPCGSL